MKNLINLKKEKGTAIIVALFVTALVAAAAIAMIEHLSIDTRRTELILNDTQANFYAEGSVAWAIDQLTNDLKQKQPEKVIDATPIMSPVNEMNGAKISSVIEDAQGKFNLNNLTDQPFQIVFTRLIPLVAPNISPGLAQTITQSVVDWITPGINSSAFDSYYGKLNPAYRSPHRPMVSVSEFRLIQGVTPELYARLLPFITALPEKTKININSASIPLIMSFSPNIKLETAKALDAFRRQSPFVNLDMLANFADIKNSPMGGNLTVSSDYFLVKTNVTIANQQMTLNTLLVRALKNSQPSVTIVSRSKGTL